MIATTRGWKLGAPHGYGVLAAGFAAAAVLAMPVTAAHSADAGLPAGAVVAFTPQTVCETLPGGWKEFAPAAGRVVVGAAPWPPRIEPSSGGRRGLLDQGRDVET